MDSVEHPVLRVRLKASKKGGDQRVCGQDRQGPVPGQQREWTAHRTRGTASGAAQQLQLPGRGDDPKVRPMEEQRLPKMPRQILESINVYSK